MSKTWKDSDFVRAIDSDFVLRKGRLLECIAILTLMG